MPVPRYIYEDFIARIETEFSVVWIKNNGDLFDQRYEEFFKDLAKDFDITSHVRPGFLTLIATRKKN